MEKKLFLIGPVGCGKSSLIREVLGERLAFAGGLITERATDENGSFMGYSLSPAAAAGGVAGFTPALYMDCRRYPPARDNEVFRAAGVRLLEEAGWYPYALLDELGGYELIIPEFRSALERVLSSGLPCVGALRSSEDADLLRSLLGLSDRYSAQHRRFLEALRRDADCRVFELREDNRAEARRLLTCWADQYAG